MTTLQIIKADLPNTPDEVIDVWLLPHSLREGFGWPPAPENQWRYVLGLGRSLEFYRQLRWELSEVIITPQTLTPKALTLIMAIYYGYRTQGYERVANIVKFIKDAGKFPLPIVLEQTSEGYTVLDGSHRLTAYFYLYGYLASDDKEAPYLNVSEKQWVWVAKL